RSRAFHLHCAGRLANLELRVDSGELTDCQSDPPVDEVTESRARNLQFVFAGREKVDTVLTPLVGRRSSRKAGVGIPRSYLRADDHRALGVLNAAQNGPGDLLREGRQGEGSNKEQKSKI